MPKFTKIHKVDHSARDMFDLVADMERYPEFVPMCDRLKIRSCRDLGERQRVIADMTIGYKIVRETFTTQVTLNRPELHVDVQYIEGPFRYLDNQWSFKEIGKNQCEIHFSIDYQFRAKSLGLLMGGMFERLFSNFVAAFEKRADQIYSVRPGNPT